LHLGGYFHNYITMHGFMNIKLADLYSNTSFNIPSNPHSQFKFVRCNVRPEWQFLEVKQAQEYCIKCKCEPTSRKILNAQLSHLSPSKVRCNSRIHPLKTRYLPGRNFVPPTLAFVLLQASLSVTCISPQISKRIRAFSYKRLSLIHQLITVRNSSTITVNPFSFSHYVM
jgi:hypothetical protein